MSGEQRLQIECKAALDLLVRLYGDRLTPDMVEGLKGSVETVVKATLALRSVRLGNGDASLEGFAPFSEEE